MFENVFMLVVLWLLKAVFNRLIKYRDIQAVRYISRTIIFRGGNSYEACPGV